MTLPARWKRRLLFGAVFAFLAANLTVALTLWWLRSSLPTIEGTATLAGLSEPVKITRDLTGVPWIRAANPEDAYFGLGYAHAQDRLWQMEFMRRIGDGRLAETLSKLSTEASNRVLPNDRFLRLLGLRHLAEESYRRAAPEVRSALEAYARGVNAFLESHTGAWPLEFIILRLDPAPWRPADSLLWSRLMALQLGFDWRSELARARMLRAGVDPALVTLLWRPEDPDHEIPTAPNLGQLGNLDSDMLEWLAAAIPDALVATGASNAWTLSSTRTASGKPLLANDPHLRFSNPNLWYLARLEAPGWLRVGATVPGVPLTILGHNGSLAWGMTATQGDTQDLFIETLSPDDPEQYLTPDGPKRFALRREKIITASGSETLVARSSRHGPVISDVLPRARAARETGTVLSLASPGLAPDDRTADALYALNAAPTVAKAITALDRFDAPQQNVMLADQAGHIAMVTAGKVPIRRGGDGFLPGDGASGRGDWTGFAPRSALPMITDPPGGALVQANNRVHPRDPALTLGRRFDAPYRAKRIVERLKAGRVTLDRMTDIQMDAVSGIAGDLGSQLVHLLGITPEGSPERRARDLIKNWDGEMHRDRPEPLILASWVKKLGNRLLADDLGREFATFQPRATALLYILKSEPRWCDDGLTGLVEDCASIARSTLSEALTSLAERYGANIEDWRWGDAHQARFAHPIFSKLPLIGRLFITTTESDGGNDTVNRGAYSSDIEGSIFDHVHGSGFRGAYDLANLERSIFAVPLGQSGNIFAAYYGGDPSGWSNGGHRRIGTKPQSRENILTLTPLNAN
ncbi:MAG: penicillin acylase family protein [Rhodospirillaceae bacterium]|nr:penicillin acylase family protein [Rhodospirillaceae bacterium]